MPTNASSPKPNFWQILVSVLGALFGVQSSKVRERDFSGARPWWVYVLVGVGVVLLFIILLLILTKFIVVTARG